MEEKEKKRIATIWATKRYSIYLYALMRARSVKLHALPVEFLTIIYKAIACKLRIFVPSR